MKLLFDQNLSLRLVVELADILPGSVHVRDQELSRADDSQVWDFAAANGFIIVSKDEDFHQRSFLYGYPPKVVWVRLGNCTTSQVSDLLRRSRSDIESFAVNEVESFMALAPPEVE